MSRLPEGSELGRRVRRPTRVEHDGSIAQLTELAQSHRKVRISDGDEHDIGRLQRYAARKATTNQTQDRDTAGAHRIGERAAGATWTDDGDPEGHL